MPHTRAPSQLLDRPTTTPCARLIYHLQSGSRRRPPGTFRTPPVALDPGFGHCLRRSADFLPTSAHSIHPSALVGVIGLLRRRKDALCDPDPDERQDDPEYKSNHGSVSFASHVQRVIPSVLEMLHARKSIGFLFNVGTEPRTAGRQSVSRVSDFGGLDRRQR